MSKRALISDLLEDLRDRLVRIEHGTARVERKVDRVVETQARLEVVVVELSKDVVHLREQLMAEAETRAGLGRTVLEHDAKLSLVRVGGKDAPT